MRTGNLMRPDPTFLVSMGNTFQSFCTADSFEIVSAYTSDTLPSAQSVYKDVMDKCIKLWNKVLMLRQVEEYELWPELHSLYSYFACVCV